MDTTIYKDFNNLNIKEDLLKGVYLYGFKDPSEIQIKGIQSINTGKDCILQSQSGTGKTGTYLLGILNNTKKKSLILAPTRELAKQIYNVAINIAKYSKLDIGLFTGGSDIKEDFVNLRTSNIIIGTIGRLNHIMNKHIYKNIEIMVIDEADNVFNDSMFDDLSNIMKNLYNCQKIFISATLGNNIMDYSKKYLKDPIKILLKKEDVPVDLISQYYIDVEVEEYKFDVLLDLYNIISTTQAIIFCNTIRKVEWISNELKKNNFSITSIHSKMTQDERNNIVQEFRNGKTRLLLTTDLLARGIDIPQVNLVVNYDLPVNKETYIHRIGRCGRFGKKGISISMIRNNEPEDVKILNRMKNYYKINIDELPADIEMLVN